MWKKQIMQTRLIFRETTVRRTKFKTVSATWPNVIGYLWNTEEENADRKPM